MENRQLFYDFKFDKDWSLVSRGLYSNQFWFLSNTQDQASPSAVVVPGIGAQLTNFGGNPNNTRLLTTYSWGDFKRETLTFNVDLNGKFETGPVQHALLVGVDYNRQKTPINTQGFSNGGPNLNLYFPNYWTNQFSFTSLPTTGVTVLSYGHAATLWRGVYAQDMMSAFDDRLHVVLGGRYDWATTGNGGGTFYEAAVPLRTSQDRAFSPRVGVLYQLLPWFSVYGNYVESFGQANSVNTLFLSAMPPQKGKQWEGGVKAELFEKRLVITASYYDIWKSNIPYPDPSNPLLIGLAESKGVEFDVTGKIDDNWSVIANYAHQDARVVTGRNVASTDLANQVSEVPQAGKWLPSVPAHVGNVWLKYTADGDLLGLSVFGGVQIVGSSFGDNANSFKIGQYTVVNGGAAYSFLWEGAKLTAQVNVTNLNDANYYVSASNRYTISSGAPRAVIGSVRVEF